MRKLLSVWCPGGCRTSRLQELGGGSGSARNSARAPPPQREIRRRRATRLHRPLTDYILFIIAFLITF